MIRAAEAEQGFSYEVRLAQFQELTERMRWDSLRRLRRLCKPMNTLSRESGAEDPISFRPPAPNFLYVLAKEARSGDYRNHMQFLHYLGFDATGDSIMALDEQLRVTFDPRGNNRHEWWLEPSGNASQWLRKKIAEKQGRLSSKPKEKNAGLNPEVSALGSKSRNRGKAPLDPQIREWLFLEEVRAMLPPMQAAVICSYYELDDPARPHEITNAVAERLGISPATVRWHKAEARKNTAFKKLLGAA